MSLEKYISFNSYRVLGVPSNASLKDIQKNISKLKAFAKIGKEMKLDYDFSCLNLSKINRTDDLLLKSENQIKLDKNRIQMSIFWFTDISPIDSVALANIFNGNVSKSIEIWEKATKSKKVNLKNYSAFNNLSTLLLFWTLDKSKTDTFKKDSDSIKIIKQAINLKNQLFSSKYFISYCESICKSSSINSDDAQQFFTNTILELLKKNFSPKELSHLFEDLDVQQKEKLNESLTGAPLSNINNHIDNASNLIKDNPKNGIQVGNELIKDTKKDIQYLKEILAVNDFQLQIISDRLANQILQCGIVCYNETGDDHMYLGSYKYALEIAIDEKTINRAEDCIEHCEKLKKANICSHCCHRTVNKDNPWELTIYRETIRYYNSVNYQKGVLNLFFCDICYKKIKDDSAREGLIILCLTILTMIIAVIVAGEWVAAIVAGFLGYLVISFIVGFVSSYASNSRALDNHPVWKKYKSNGWRLKPPKA